MKKEGLPIEGLCVAAGIPSTEKAKEIIDGLRDAGIKHVSFKPGSSFSTFFPFFLWLNSNSDAMAVLCVQDLLMAFDK